MNLDSRAFFNEHRLTAIALGKVFAEDIVLKSNETEILQEKRKEFDDKLCAEKVERVKKAKVVLKIP